MTGTADAVYMSVLADCYAGEHMPEQNRPVWSRSASMGLQAVAAYDALMDCSLCELLPGCW